MTSQPDSRVDIDTTTFAPSVAWKVTWRGQELPVRFGTREEAWAHLTELHASQSKEDAA